MKYLKIKLSTIGFFMALFVFAANAQQIAISGTVRDARSGEEIIGANIIERGTTNGTITDVDGNFRLSVAPNATLVVSFIGYVNQEVAVGGRASFLIELREDAIALQEIVAIGYGTQTRREITGAVSSVRPESFNQGIVGNPMGLLQGRVAGLNIVQRGGGDPAHTGFEIQLRGLGSLSGAQEPLIVIDGVPGGDLSLVLPSDIYSIDVLRDGSAAAIYGTRANAGVILITTRRGNTDGSFSAEYQGTASLATIARRPQVLNAREFRQHKVANGLGQDWGHGTDWVDAIMRTALSQTHNVAISGGTRDFNYRASVGYRNLQGIMLRSDYEEINARFAANQRALNNRLDIAYNFAYTSGNRTWADHDNFYQAMRSNPTAPIRVSPDHEDYERFGGFFELPDFASRNPVSNVMQVTNHQKDQVMLGSVRATLSILPNLRFTTFYSHQNRSRWNGRYDPSTLRGFDELGGRAEQSQRHETHQVVENTLHFMNDWGAHTFQALAGQAYEIDSRHGFNVFNTNFPLDRLLYNNLWLGEGRLTGEEARANMGSFKFRDKLAAFFGRVMYNYDGRYFLSASVRVEGSSRFGPNAHPTLGPWGIFPAISGSWNIMGEEFMSDVDFFQDLRMRLGYGVTGNMPGDSYLHIMRVAPGGGFIFSDGDWIRPWGIANNANPYIRWERKHEYNFGVDFAILNNRLSGSIDAYFRNTTDLLWQYDVPMPPYPVARMWDNHGQIHNFGVELLLNGNVIRQRDLNWDLTLTAAWNDNRVVQITSGHRYAVEGASGFLNVGYIASGEGETGNFVMRLEEGQPIGNFWGFRFAGFQADGTRVFRTPAGGYTTDPQEHHRMILGNAQPLVIFGLGSNLRWRQFDMVMNFHGRIGGLIFNETRYFLEHPFGENSLRSTFEGGNMRWVQGVIREIQESGNDEENNSRMAQRLFSDHYLESATFLQLGDLTIGYRPRLPASLTDYVNNLRITFTAQNLFTLRMRQGDFVAYSGDNPAAVSISGLDPGFSGRSFYPMPRSFNLGLSFNF